MKVKSCELIIYVCVNILTFLESLQILILLTLILFINLEILLETIGKEVKIYDSYHNILRWSLKLPQAERSSTGP